MSVFEINTTRPLFFLICLTVACTSNDVLYNTTDSTADVNFSMDVISEDVTSDIPTIGPYSECESDQEGIICIGVAKSTITPTKYELVKRELLRTRSYCPEFDGPGNCGSIDINKWKNLSKRWKTDFFFDCGTDRVCPEDENYTGPDADGSEKDGRFQGYWIAGFSASLPMMGIHDDITVRAITLRHGPTTIAIITLDLIGFFKSDVDRIRRLLEERAPNLRIDDILVVSSHTHSSIDTVGMWGPQDPFSEVLYESGASESYVREVIGKTVDTIISAGISMQRGRVRAITKRVGIDQMATDLRDPFIIDDNMSVVMFEDLNKNPIATLVNWGSHPEGLAGTSNLVSSDYVHFLREALERGIFEGPRQIPPIGGTVLFIQGALGGMITNLHLTVYDDDGNKIERENSFRAIKQVGYNLARKAYEIYKESEYINNLAISVRKIEYKIPLENKFFWMMFDLGWLRDRPKWKIDPTKETYLDNVEIQTEVLRIKIGEIDIQSIPGEIFPELSVGGYREPYEYSFGHPIIKEDNMYPPDLANSPTGPYIRDIMRGKIKIIAGLGNDFLGYILPEYDFKLSEDYPYFTAAPGEHYEETRSVGIQHVNIMLEEIKKLYKDE
ncbi:MAG: hypothetical protein N2746_06195 [Deltaproteobacteria bacterium]|nr:hypothetical protein [Deltaproteobacteria bacterium]